MIDECDRHPPTRKISTLWDGRDASPENGAKSETLGLLRPKTFQLANLPTCQRKARNEQVVFGHPLKVTSEDGTLVTAAQVATELGCLRMWHRPRAAAKEDQ